MRLIFASDSGGACGEWLARAPVVEIFPIGSISWRRIFRRLKQAINCADCEGQRDVPSHCNNCVGVGDQYSREAGSVLQLYVTLRCAIRELVKQNCLGDEMFRKRMEVFHDA